MLQTYHQPNRNMKVKQLLAVGIAFLLLSSCQKEVSGDLPGQGSNDLTGTWTFIGLHAKTRSDVNIDDPIAGNTEAVTVSEYYSQNNGGTWTFTPTNVSYNALTYSLDTIARGYLYESGVLMDSFDFPLVATVPPTDASAGYTKIGGDSIRYSTVLIDPGGTGSVATDPGGARLRFDGNKLFVKSSYTSTTTENVFGATQTKTNSVEAEIALQKQ